MSSLDASPFISPPPSHPTTARAQGVSYAARMIQRASGLGRYLRAASVTVRETAAREIEGRQTDWYYSHPIVVLDAVWNLAFVLAAFAALFLTLSDSPRLPLRVWIVAYALQCLVHVFCVSLEFRRRRRTSIAVADASHATDDNSEDSGTMIKQLETANTMFSFVWWILGFYWICVGSNGLLLDSPILYWLCIAFLILDLCFAFFCVILALAVAVAVCFCLPCIIAFIYIMQDLPQGASQEDVGLLRKYTFFKCDSEEINGEIQSSCGGIMKECGTDSPVERTLTAEDAECCICLGAYEDGTEVRELPCNHHYHCSCVDKWLYINSTCPLCKYDILKGSYDDGEV